MNQRLGMDPGAARGIEGQMRSQLSALTTIVSDLTSTHSAASNPQLYGIESGERTVAPWSMGTLQDARLLVHGANTAAGALLDRISTEAAAQEAASANDVPFLGFVNDVRRTRTFLLAGPRAWLQAPAAIGLLRTLPWLGPSVVMPSTWFSMVEYRFGSALMSGYSAANTTNRFVRGLALTANAFKPDRILQGAAGLVGQGNASWVTSSSSWLSRAGAVAGKGFGVLGAGIGAYNLVNGIVGMTDGHVSDEDGWAVVDGAVGLITGIGSLAPPPVGVVFAAVGGAYALGRWMFGEDANGMTGIDHIGSFANDVGNNVSAAWNTTTQAVADVISDPVGAARDVIDNLWPW
ncbi:hypothetical protein FB562_0624 [Homoserinimonas aerilata]|uniref:Uncharacterized protein n=1 Tax=Homoserinimonas aerilata TaxID=1162970 RepID=A0A542YHI2_9MICO|nr:hypothetical protein [Homoserinimonas aerilata]TQL47559.1 hypothetical protein FB562_0624 [Homoserinimonas aerilata]